MDIKALTRSCVADRAEHNVNYLESLPQCVEKYGKQHSLNEKYNIGVARVYSDIFIIHCFKFWNHSFFFSKFF